MHKGLAVTEIQMALSPCVTWGQIAHFWICWHNEETPPPRSVLRKPHYLAFVIGTAGVPSIRITCEGITVLGNIWMQNKQKMISCFKALAI